MHNARVRNRVPLWLAVALVIGVSPVVLGVAWVVTSHRGTDVVWKSCSDRPEDAQKTCAFLLYVGTRRPFPGLSAEREHELWITRGQDTPAYGHATRYGLHASLTPEAEWLSRSRGHWDERGFTFEEPSGHRIFVPRAAFVGGR